MYFRHWDLFFSRSFTMKSSSFSGLSISMKKAMSYFLLQIPKNFILLFHRHCRKLSLIFPSGVPNLWIGIMVFYSVPEISLSISSMLIMVLYRQTSVPEGYRMNPQYWNFFLPAAMHIPSENSQLKVWEMFSPQGMRWVMLLGSSLGLTLTCLVFTFSLVSTISSTPFPSEITSKYRLFSMQLRLMLVISKVQPFRLLSFSDRRCFFLVWVLQIRIIPEESTKLLTIPITSLSIVFPSTLTPIPFILRSSLLKAPSISLIRFLFSSQEFRIMNPQITLLSPSSFWVPRRMALFFSSCSKMSLFIMKGRLLSSSFNYIFLALLGSSMLLERLELGFSSTFSNQPESISLGRYSAICLRSS